MPVEVVLTQGYVALVDDEDAERVLAHKWYAHRERHGVCAVRTETDESTGRQRFVYMHRFIVGAQAGVQVDHVNHNPLDNRSDNLRACTNAENQCNARKQRRSTSSTYKGVGWHKGNRKWRAQIKVNRCQRHLGNFDNEIDAARAYDKAAKELFGEFALINGV